MWKRLILNVKGNISKKGGKIIYFFIYLKGGFGWENICMVCCC